MNAIDTTAAGDTFIGTLACEISKRKNLDDAVKIANKAAAICMSSGWEHKKLFLMQQKYNYKQYQQISST